MIGVILWSDPADRKAVIWCEDQGDLAFFNAQDSTLDANAFFDAGDVVQFDMELDSSIRRASNPQLLLEKTGKSLPQALRAAVPDVRPAEATAEVIPFRPLSGQRQSDSDKSSRAFSG
ncbi:MAG: hypothetical protein AB8B58_09680 [Roseobacter sp.]